MTEELYAGRDSIHPRAFAVRHLIIQDVKFRKAAALPGSPDAARLDGVARGVDVTYEGAGRELVVRWEGLDVRRIALDAIPLYSRGDTSAPPHRPGANVRHWDEALEENRRLAHSLVDEMLRRIEGAAP